MSLEEALKENTAALKENSALMLEVIGMSETGGTTSSSSGDDDSGEKPKRKRGEPSPGKKRRTKAEVEEDEAAEAAEKAAAAGGDEGSDDSDDDAVDFKTMKSALAEWLGEFGKQEDKNNPDGVHPEVTARRAALKKVFGSEKVGVEKLDELQADDKAEARKVVLNWLENKAKKYDEGYGKGRLAPDPEPEEDSSDDGLDI